MYIMGSYEFRQYVNASDILRDLVNLHKMAIHEAYEDIHATRTGWDYDQGKVYSESINVADYAIWLIETKELQDKQQVFWRLRVEKFNEAFKSLDVEEIKLFHEVKSNMVNLHSGHHVVMDKLKRILERSVSPEAEFIPKDYFDDDLDAYDARVDKMTWKELKEDYWDQDEVSQVAL